MLYSAARKIGNIARYNDFSIIIVNPFEISELPFNRFGRREKIADLYIKNVFALIGDEIYFVIVGFADFHVVTAI